MWFILDVVLNNCERSTVDLVNINPEKEIEYLWKP